MRNAHIHPTPLGLSRCLQQQPMARRLEGTTRLREDMLTQLATTYIRACQAARTAEMLYFAAQMNDANVNHFRHA